MNYTILYFFSKEFISYLYNLLYNSFGDTMYTIKENTKKELLIKNSRFIAVLKKIERKEDVPSLLEKIKKTYPKATHYCYAYIIDDVEKSSDDKEPSGTAGLPILNVLKKQEMNHIIAVVIRYFGGIKLGAGGLVRAYSKSVKETLEEVEKNTLEKAFLVEIEIDYKEQKKLDYLLKDSTILKKEFREKVFYQFLIEEKKIDILSSYSYQIIRHSLLEKES